MKKPNARMTECTEEIVRTHGDMLFRICLIILKNKQDAEDAVSETMIKYIEKNPAFKDKEHEKAWLIRTAKNKSIDILRKRNIYSDANAAELQKNVSFDCSETILSALMSLPEKFRIVLTLYYVEEYPIKIIAQIIQKTPSAVKMRLQKGRRMLEEAYKKEYM